MISETGHRLFILIFYLVLLYAHDFAAAEESIQLGPNRGNRIVLHHSVSEQFQFDKTERLWRFVIFQGHSQKEKISLSTDAHFSYGYTDTGSNVGVLDRLDVLSSNDVFLNSGNSTKDVNVDVIAVPYKEGAPLPGGCCLTCSTEFDPNIIVTYTAAETKVTFSIANVYYPKNGSSEGPPCDGNEKHGKKPEHFRLEYHIYQMFLEEGDLSEETYFKGIENMAYPAVIKANGEKVTTVKTPNIPVIKFDTQRVGQGVVFNIIVYDPSTRMEAAYSPTVTYACNLNSKVDACHSPMQDVISTGVFAVFGALVSLVLCFTGFRFFQFTLFVGGLVNFSFVFFIIVTANSDISHLGRMLMSAGCGVICGLLVLALWWFTQWTRFCLFIDALFLGFLVGATLFFTPLGAMDVFQSSEFDYAAVLCCCTLIFPVVLILWPRVLCIVYTSIVSGYGFVVGIGFFLHSSLSYIVVDVLIRATEAQYRRDHVYVTRPFQRNDYYLSGTWIFLSVLGCIVQYALSRDRPYFPRSGFVEQKKIRKYLSNKRTDERTPLLINSKQGEGGANGIC